MNDRKTTPDKDSIQVKVRLNTNFFSSFITGLGGAVGFHPFDRALYLQVTDKLADKKPLFHSKYWQSPWTGLSATLVQRTCSTGLYFYAQEHFQREWYPFLRKDCGWGELSAKFAVGASAGAVAGLFSNFSYAIKFYTIQKNGGSFLNNGKELMEALGYKAFTRGAPSGISRDIIWGGVYTGLFALLDKTLKPINNLIPEENHFQKSSFTWSLRFISACLGTILSSPLNYSRNKQFATPLTEKAPLAMDLWCGIWLESNKFLESLEQSPELHKTIGHSKFPRMRFFANKLGWGPGTVRAAAGMAVLHAAYERVNTQLKTYDETDESTQHALDIISKAMKP